MYIYAHTHGASLVSQTVKNLPVMRDTWVRSLGWEDPLEKGMATHSSILTWRTPQTEEAGGLQSMGSQRVGHDRATTPPHTHTTECYSAIKKYEKYEILPFVTTWMELEGFMLSKISQRKKNTI